MENGTAPATKQDVIDAVNASEARLIGMIQATEDRLTDMIKASEDRVIEKMRDIQTEMLKAFYSLIESNQKRFAQIETEAAALSSRLATVEERLLDLERKVNIPKPPSAPPA